MKELRKKDEEKKQLVRDIKELQEEVENIKDEGRTTEMDLLQELDMLHDKNSVMRYVKTTSLFLFIYLLRYCCLFD